MPDGSSLPLPWPGPSRTPWALDWRNYTMNTMHFDGLGINATSGPLTGYRVAHVKNECPGFTEQERNELGRAMAAAPEMLDALESIIRLTEISDVWLPVSWKDQARAAIARATQP